MVAQTTSLEFVKPKSEVSIRAKPPSGSVLSIAGQEIGRADTDRPYLVLGKIETKRGFSTEIWVRIAPVIVVATALDQAILAVTRDLYPYITTPASVRTFSAADVEAKERSDTFLEVATRISQVLSGLTWGDLAVKPDGSGRLTVSAETSETIPRYLSPNTIQSLEALRQRQSPDGSRTKIFDLDAVEIVSRLNSTYAPTADRALEAVKHDTDMDPDNLRELTWDDLEVASDGSGRLTVSAETSERNQRYLHPETVHALEMLRVLRKLRAHSANSQDLIFSLSSARIMQDLSGEEWKVDVSKLGWAYWGKRGRSNFTVVPTSRLQYHTVLQDRSESNESREN